MSVILHDRAKRDGAPEEGGATGWRHCRSAARMALLVGSAGIIVVGVASGTAPILGLPTQIAVWIVRSVFALGFLATIAVMSGTGMHYAVAISQLFWLIIALCGAASLATAHDGLAGLVPLAECCVLALATRHAGTVPLGPQAATKLAVACSAMLALFGAIHFGHRAELSVLIPSWVPWRDNGPIITGTILVVTSPLLLVRSYRVIAAVAVAVMFASWLPLVHLPRLVAEPTSAFEWQFAWMAVALVGALLLVGCSQIPHDDV